MWPKEYLKIKIAHGFFILIFDCPDNFVQVWGNGDMNKEM